MEGKCTVTIDLLGKYTQAMFPEEKEKTGRMIAHKGSIANTKSLLVISSTS